MVALDTPAPSRASQSGELRRWPGLALAVAWMLVQLWHASPLPYLLGSDAGLPEIVPYGDFYLLHFAFAAAAALLLFPSYSFRSTGIGVALAVVAALVVSYGLWEPLLGLKRDLQMSSLTAKALPLDIAMAGLALLVMVVMAGCIFGRLGAVLALVALLPPSYVASIWSGLDSSLASWVAELTALLLGHQIAQAQFGKVYLQISAGIFFLVVALGAGLDHIGIGRNVLSIGRRLKGLPQPAVQTPVAGVCAASAILALVLYFADDIGRTLLGIFQSVTLLGIAAALYLLAVFLGARWKDEIGQAAGTQARRRQRLLAAMQWLALVAATAAVVFGAAGLAVDFLTWHGRFWLGGNLSALICVGLAILTVPVALFDRRGDVAKALRALVAVLPVFTLHWLMAAEGFSPALAAFWAMIVVFFCLLAQRLRAAPPSGQAGAMRLRSFLGEDVSSLCVATARTMAGVALVAAFSWPIYLWWFDLSSR